MDLQNEFTWMTKQLFLYVTVEFETPQNSFNQMVMWSHIITNKVQTRADASSLLQYFLHTISNGQVIRHLGWAGLG